MYVLLFFLEQSTEWENSYLNSYYSLESSAVSEIHKPAAMGQSARCP